jgi:16S rRNA (cytidine1402-2'-O)-methyltransferase
MPGTLYIVPTPIGNLEDITLRALNMLKQADAILCEDTRQTVNLLNHYDIRKPLISFYSYNQFRKIPEILEALASGKQYALVSDAGTPGISDPGYELIKQVIEKGINVVSLPGPCAVITALVASGLDTDGFVFLGFLKRKPGKMKKEVLEALLLGKTVVFYESPFRLKKTMGLLAGVTPPETKVVVAREITKKFEEYVRGSFADIIGSFEDREVKGEVVVMIEPYGKTREREEENCEQD